MKLDSSLNYYNKLIDKSLDLNERLKLGESLWHLDDTAQVQGNKQQLIIDWTIDLLINKRRYSFSENDFNNVLERLNYFLHDEKFKNTPINGGLNFVQVLFEAFGSNNGLLKKTVHECCFRLFQTKFSQYITRNIDQMTRIVNFYIIDINELLMSEKSSELAVSESLTRVYLVLQKYFLCFKSQQNQSRLFNRLCSQILFNLLKLIDNLTVKKCGQEVCDISWKILKYGLFSKLHSNTYQDFFKNLPASFSPKSNYQVAVLFTTIQTEASKSLSNLSSICKVIHLITREIFRIMSVDDYKIKMSMIQFVMNLLWDLKDSEADKMDTDGPQEKNNVLGSQQMDVLIAAMANMLQIIDDLRLFNKIDDGNNQNMFKTWSQEFIVQTFKCKFNEIYADFLTKFLLIDHVILDSELETILRYLQIEENLTKFLSVYLECNVKFRQLSRATHILIDVLGKNKKLNLPIEFHDRFSNSLESYNVDSQSVIHLWKELNGLLKSCTVENLKVELLKFLTSILSRVNLTNQRLPTHLKAQAMEYLDETKKIVFDYLINETDFSDKNMLLVYFLECFQTCGLLYLILYRFSITSSSHLTSATSMVSIEHSKSCLNDLTEFLTLLNKTFQLDDKIEKQIKVGKNFKLLFYLNKLQLLNIFESNLKELSADSSKCVSRLLSSVEAFYSTDLNYDCIDSFDIEHEIQKSSDFSALHLKVLVLDNFYIITPLLTHDQGLMKKYLMIILQFILKADDKKLDIEKINLNSMFNDKSIVSGLLIASIKILIANSNADAKIEKFLNKLVELVQSDGKDEDLKATLFESKKYTKVSLNKTQARLVIKLASYFPLEFLETKHALIFYFFNEKITADDSDLEERKINVYFRLFSSMALIEQIPIVKIKSWLVSLLGLYETDSITKLSNSIFEKLIKKCAKKLLMDDSLECLTDFVDCLIEKLSTSMNNINFVSFAHLTLIQVLENISKVQEFTLTLKKDSENMTHLNEVFNKILNFFIEISGKMNNEKKSEYFSEFQENHLFYICLILMRRICSSIESINQDNVKQFEYFKNLYSTCLKTHKEKMKIVKNVATDEQLNRVKINAFHIDFIKSCIYYSETLSSKDETLRIKPVKMCKNLVDILLAINSNYEFDMNYLSKLNPNSSYDVKDSSNNLESLKYILIKSIALSMNTFSVEDITSIFEYFESQVILDKCSNSAQSCYLTKINILVEFVGFVTCDLEIREELKLTFSEFTQKILVQLQPLYTNLRETNQTNNIISLLKLQTKIVGSKYFLFPSHLVISTLQTFVSLDLTQFPLEKYADLQELVCKSMNNILNRYSKKFSKIAAVICNLLTKLITQTTCLSNQTNLSEDNLPFAIKAAQDLERIITRLSVFKKNFCKIAPYMIAEYACIANTIPIHPSVKNVLASAMYNLISICDIYGISQLHVALPVGAKDLFKTTYAEYEKYFKYTGKT